MEDNTIENKILRWMAKGNTGFASKTMAFIAVGLSPHEIKSFHTPSDVYDFEKCLELVKSVPEIKCKFHEISKVSKEWMQIITHWDYVEELFFNEIEGRDDCRAPETYKVIQSLLNGTFSKRRK